VENYHFEGWTVAGVYLNGANGNVTFGGQGEIKNYFNNLTLFHITNTAGSSAIRIGKCHFDSTGGLTGTTGIMVAGANVVGLQIDSECSFDTCTTGINDSGTNTRVLDAWFYACGAVTPTYPIRANGNRSQYLNNRFEATVSANTINHVAGTVGLWQGNDFDKAPLATLSGAQGNYSGIRVKDNIGFVTRNSGTTGSITTTTNIAHGLVGVPANPVMVGSFTAGLAGLYQSAAATSTNIQFAWTGTANAQLYWEARCPCDY
jgi:hypothetical protein